MKKIILFVVITFIFSIQANSKDLSGNAIDCYDLESYSVDVHNHASVLFLNEKQAKFSLAVYFDEEFEILISGETFNYEVTKDKIILKSENIKNLYDPLGWWKRIVNENKGEIKIWRQSLNMDFYIKRIGCNLVDSGDSNIFKKYEKFQDNLDNLLKKSKNKNIL